MTVAVQSCVAFLQVANAALLRRTRAVNEFTRHTPSVATAISAGVNDSAMVVVGLIASLQRFAATDDPVGPTPCQRPSTAVNGNSPLQKPLGADITQRVGEQFRSWTVIAKVRETLSPQSPKPLHSTWSPRSS